MKPILFQYRSRKLEADDIAFIKALIDRHFFRGRSHISRELCKSWNWMQSNGKLKEYAARDLGRTGLGGASTTNTTEKQSETKGL
jgi:hypothetical protein